MFVSARGETAEVLGTLGKPHIKTKAAAKDQKTGSNQSQGQRSMWRSRHLPLQLKGLGPQIGFPERLGSFIVWGYVTSSPDGAGFTLGAEPSPSSARRRRQQPPMAAGSEVHSRAATRTSTCASSQGDVAGRAPVRATTLPQIWWWKAE